MQNAKTFQIHVHWSLEIPGADIFLFQRKICRKCPTEPVWICSRKICWIRKQVVVLMLFLTHNGRTNCCVLPPVYSTEDTLACYTHFPEPGHLQSRRHRSCHVRSRAGHRRHPRGHLWRRGRPARGPSAHLSVWTTALWAGHGLSAGDHAHINTAAAAATAARCPRWARHWPARPGKQNRDKNIELTLLSCTALDKIITFHSGYICRSSAENITSCVRDSFYQALERKRRNRLWWK